MTRPAGPITLEICVDTPEGLRTAVAAGADRIELCASLGVGGLTPSPGLIELARRVEVPVFVMIRPRSGDFVYGDDEVAAMLADIAAVRAAGLAGVVLGASRPDRTLDTAVLTALISAAAGLGRTLHRAFDLAPDQEAALEAAVSLGFDRILTSGGMTDAAQGRRTLAGLVRAARGRLSIMPAAGCGPTMWPTSSDTRASARSTLPERSRFRRIPISSGGVSRRTAFRRRIGTRFGPCWRRWSPRREQPPDAAASFTPGAILSNALHLGNVLPTERRHHENGFHIC